MSNTKELGGGSICLLKQVLLNAFYHIFVLEEILQNYMF